MESGPMKSKLLILVVAGVLPGLAAAQVYRWVDEDGKVHYSDKPVEQAERVNIRVDRPRPSAGEASAEQAAGSSIEDQIAAEEDPVKKAQLQVRKQECDLARAVLDKYANAPYLVEKQADGTERRLSDDEAAAEKSKVEQQVANNC